MRSQVRFLLAPPTAGFTNNEAPDGASFAFQVRVAIGENSLAPTSAPVAGWLLRQRGWVTMSRQRIASSRISSHQMLVHRTSAHLRAATNGLIGAILLAAVAVFAALTIWPSYAERFGADSAVEPIRDEGWDRYAPIVLVAAAVLGAVALAYATHRARRWRFERQINRISASLSTTDPSMIDPVRDHRTVAIGLPPPRIQWIWRRPPWNAETATVDAGNEHRRLAPPRDRLPPAVQQRAPRSVVCQGRVARVRLRQHAAVRRVDDIEGGTALPAERAPSGCL